MTRERWALRAFRWIYVAFIVWASATTLNGPEASGDAGAFIRLLAGAEIAVALLFLVEPLEIVACALLVAIYVVASFLSVSHGVTPLRFLYYAATALYIVCARRQSRSPHGSVKRSFTAH